VTRQVLVTGHGADAFAVNKARRTVPYRTLVLVTADARAGDLTALKETEALMNVDVRVEPVDAADFMSVLETANRILDAHAPDVVKVHVAGGPNLVTNALLLAAFQKGVEAFYCHPKGVSRLPVAKSVDLVERFNGTQRRVLAGIPAKGAMPLKDLIIVTGLAAATVKSALLRLRQQGLVDANHERAGLTSVGRYYRAHFQDTSGIGPVADVAGERDARA
jgi:hypothetical protein